jgi:hypothetical protein
MKRRDAQKAYLSEWLLEFSVLWAVFPLLDQILSGQIRLWILGLAFVLVVLSLVLGFVLVKGDR